MSQLIVSSQNHSFGYTLYDIKWILKWAFTKVMRSLPVMSNIDVCRQQRAAIEVEIVQTHQIVYRDKALCQLTVCQWLDIFRSSNFGRWQRLRKHSLALCLSDKYTLQTVDHGSSCNTRHTSNSWPCFIM